MKRIIIFAVATALLTWPGSSAAQERPGPGMSSVQVVLDNAEELDLTAEQIEALGAVRDELRENTAPTLEQLQEMRAEGDMRSRRDEVQPLMGELQTANREAEAAALALLGEEQRASAERILEKHRQEARQRMRERQPRGR
jgi:hypothetical protein